MPQDLLWLSETHPSISVHWRSPSLTMESEMKYSTSYSLTVPLEMKYTSSSSSASNLQHSETQSTRLGTRRLLLWSSACTKAILAHLFDTDSCGSIDPEKAKAHCARRLRAEHRYLVPDVDAEISAIKRMLIVRTYHSRWPRPESLHRAQVRAGTSKTLY